MNRLLFSVVAAALVALPTLASAQDADEPAICTDRPTKANGVCTVPPGKWQVEADAVSFTRYEDAGTTVEILLYTNPTLKFGLDDRSDLQINWSPQMRVETTVGGTSSRLSGPGDLYVRYKRRLSADDATWGVSVIPFLKAPTARAGIGNREWEGGVALPLSRSLPSGVTLTFGPEIDVLLDADGRSEEHTSELQSH